MAVFPMEARARVELAWTDLQSAGARGAQRVQPCPQSERQARGARDARQRGRKVPAPAARAPAVRHRHHRSRPAARRAAARGSRRQRVVGFDAGVSGDAGLIGGRSKLSSSIDKPSLQVGEQIAGALGWRAACGSGGIAAGRDGGGALAQPVTSHSAAHSSITRASGEAFGFIGDLPVFGGAAAFLGARGLLGGERCGRALGGFAVDAALQRSDAKVLDAAPGQCSGESPGVPGQRADKA
jgi:hypothetical protein